MLSFACACWIQCTDTAAAVKIHSNLVVAVGQDCHASEPGFFRVCYAIVDKDTILKLVERLTSYISKSDQDRKSIPLRVKPANLDKAQKIVETQPPKRAEPMA